MECLKIIEQLVEGLLKWPSDTDPIDPAKISHKNQDPVNVAFTRKWQGKK